MEWVKFNECLEVNKFGAVRSVSRDVCCTGNANRRVKSRELKQRLGGRGYMILCTKCHAKTASFLVHRLIATAFIPNPNNYPQINHKDGCKTNNHVDNLEWVSQSQNQRHAYVTGLQKIKCSFPDEVQKVIAALSPLIPVSTHEIGRALGITGSTVQGYIKKWSRDGE